jgi:lysine-N-methylase
MPWFGPIRQSALALVVNRAYPLWQRLFLLGVFCRRLDAISSGELRRGVPAFLTDFEATVASAALRTAMETLLSIAQPSWTWCCGWPGSCCTAPA